LGIKLNKQDLTTELKKEKQDLSRKILFHFSITFILYLLAGIILFLFSILIYSQITWYGHELIYLIVHWLFDRTFWVALLYFVIGFSVIFYYYWKKPFYFLDHVLEATENMYHLDDRLIELPSELKQTEFKMNQLKMTLRNNAHIAKEAEQRKNDLVVYLAHDLKTPLTSVIGYLTLLRDEGQISEELREKYLSISLDKAERLEYLINEFFEITRFNLSNLTLELEHVNLTRMFEQLIFEFQPMLIEKDLKCQLQATPNISIKCDVNKMQRVIDNLLHNAVNYSFKDTTIDITIIQLDDRIKISFINHGNTIPKEKLDLIFQQFYRLDFARTTKNGGAGLGLAIARQIIELHGGSIAAYSENEVTSIEFSLPTS